MTPKQIELARHALGLRDGRHQSYRNHFVAGVGHMDYADWMEMVERGEATRRAGNSLTGGDDCFFMTSSGAKLALHPGERLDPEDFPAAKLDS